MGTLPVLVQRLGLGVSQGRGDLESEVGRGVWDPSVTDVVVED